MSKHPVRCCLLAMLVCAVLGACQDRRDPVKPTVTMHASALATDATAVS